MFCPKCGKSNSGNVKYCRSCGLGLETIANVVQTELLKRETQGGFFNERFFGRLGYGFLYAFLSVGFGFLFTIAVYYKFQLFGAELMGYFAIFGFVLLGVLSALFFGVQKYVAHGVLERPEASPDTAQLNSEMAGELPAGSLESARSAASVTENTTELLNARIKQH